MTIFDRWFGPKSGQKLPVPGARSTRLAISPERAAALIADSAQFGAAVLKHDQMLLEFLGDPTSGDDRFLSRLNAAHPELGGELMAALTPWINIGREMLTRHESILRANLF